MHTGELTADTLSRLRERRPYPAVTITLPTHRHGPENNQDVVRLRNLIAATERRLTEAPHVSRQSRDAVVRQLRAAVDDLDLRYALDGLVVLADENEYHVWPVPRWVPERVVLSDSWLTRNLVAARAAERSYHLLVISADRGVLWRGAPEHLEELEVCGFPMTMPSVPEQNFDPERTHRTGGPDSLYTQERTKSFFRDIATAVEEVCRKEPLPLFVAGLPEALGLFTDVLPPALGIAGRLTKGGLADASAPALLEEMKPALEEYAHRRTEQVGEELDTAVSRKSFAAGLDEVWTAVREGRAGMVAVEEHYRTTVQISDGHLRPLPTDGEADTGGTAGANGDGDGAVANGTGNGNGGEVRILDFPPSGFAERREEATPVSGVPGEHLGEVREDIVDEVAETALDTGAKVVFVEDGALADHGRLAAVLRY
ncbi:chemotaxis protein [Streptomyces sp. ST2-7A]|uniref:baeRF3 domain-containing protein n=1 Tax=Streptomyces sp. ST2-7A TaxID=2907214 RepID=UPI001F3CFDB4|nr:chemotaxis protein [Streptomyces sp. ST2-7A]MCE7080092.1 chemotaxis protein [Streptomyces sp. ST2-7A]